MVKHPNIYFRGQSNEAWNLTPSISRIEDEVVHASSVESNFISYETTYYHCILDSPLFDQDHYTSNNPNHFLSLLAKMQHYGFNTRLLDLTKDLNIARYFACNKDLYVNGKVFQISTKTYANRKQDGILRLAKTENKRIYLKVLFCMYGCLRVNNLKEKLDAEEKSLDRVEDIHTFMTTPVIVDYTKLKLTAEDHLYNKRLEHQKGAFILFGNLIDQEKNEDIILSPRLYTNLIEDTDSVEVLEIIPKEKKLSTLLHLAHLGIHYAYLFPDAEKTYKATSFFLIHFNHKVTLNYHELFYSLKFLFYTEYNRTNEMMNEDLERTMLGFIESVLYLNDPLIFIHLKNLILFGLTDLLDLRNEMNQNDLLKEYFIYLTNVVKEEIRLKQQKENKVTQNT